MASEVHLVIADVILHLFKYWEVYFKCKLSINVTNINYCEGIYVKVFQIGVCEYETISDIIDHHILSIRIQFEN